MQIKDFNKLDVKVYEETLPSGLHVYIVPLNRNGITASLTTLFGSKDLNFIPYGKSKMHYFPPGVAHFLEHKMFERGEGKSVFEFFNESGTYNNAYTFKNKTQYVFEGPYDFENNLNFLLDFVLEPCFDKKSVEKEKPIIIEEAKANFDSPINVAYDVALKNTFHENPYMYPIIGTYESISAINKNHLMLCHQTFYNPANMLLVVSGNIDPEKTIDLVKNNFAKKTFEEVFPIKKEEINEADNVSKEYEETNMPITHEVFYLAYKINTKKLKLSIKKVKNYLNTLFILKLGNLSRFNDVGIRNGDLIGQLGLDILITGDHLIFGIYGEVKDSIKTITDIQNELADLSIDEKDLELIKRSTLGNLVLMNEQVSRINSKIVDDICTYGKVCYDVYDVINNMNIEEYNVLAKNLDLTNYTISIVKNKKKS